MPAPGGNQWKNLVAASSHHLTLAFKRLNISSRLGFDEAVFSSIVAGASGYLLKNTSKSDLVKAIRALGHGKALLDPAITKKVTERLVLLSRRQKELKGERLSEREREVLALVARGLTNKEIAERLFLSDHTVRNHVSCILKKFGLSRRSEAAAVAVRRRLVQLEDVESEH